MPTAILTHTRDDHTQGRAHYLVHITPGPDQAPMATVPVSTPLTGALPAPVFDTAQEALHRAGWRLLTPGVWRPAPEGESGPRTLVRRHAEAPPGWERVPLGGLTPGALIAVHTQDGHPTADTGPHDSALWAPTGPHTRTVTLGTTTPVRGTQVEITYRAGHGPVREITLSTTTRVWHHPAP